MIDWIEGKVCSKEPTKLILEKGGIAFTISIPLSTYGVLNDIGEKVKIFIYLSLKNEELKLFGFKTQKERNFFQDLLLVPGIGTGSALRMLSSISFQEFKSMVIKGDTESIVSIKGIGEKRANQLLFTLKEKYKKEEIPDSFESNAIRALISLGINAKKARQLISKIKAPTLEELIKQALKKL
ncbi:Holliday junction branch migration protein RuvA [candidate division WOR-3 bacterium]|nr:Holliday junction branch migration protein RuvA [candidate division WOR-3 bacterium]